MLSFTGDILIGQREFKRTYFDYFLLIKQNSWKIKT